MEEKQCSLTEKIQIFHGGGFHCRVSDDQTLPRECGA